MSKGGKKHVEHRPGPPGLPKEVLVVPADAHTSIPERGWNGLARLPFYAHEGGLLDPGVRDAVEPEQDEAGKWYPNSDRTELLVACVHACKDLLALAGALDAHDPWKGRRQIALLATPLVNLCDAAKKLYDGLGREQAERSTWPSPDQDLWKQVGRRLKRHKDGPVRLLRHKCVAHVDPEILKPGGAAVQPSADIILPVMADSLAFLLLALNYRRVFTWIRQPKGCAPDEAEVMTEYPLALRVKLGPGRGIQGVLMRGTVALDPRGYIRDTLFQAVVLHNKLAAAATPPRNVICLLER